MLLEMTEVVVVLMDKVVLVLQEVVEVVLQLLEQIQQVELENPPSQTNSSDVL